MRNFSWGMILAAFVFMVAGSVGTAHAVSSYMTTFNSRYPASPLVGNCKVCHPSYPSGYARDAYGSAFAGAGRNYATIETADSDSDGFTNLVEINAGTFPGVATSKPAVTVTLASLAISGPASLNENGTASYTATATMSNNSTKVVTATWSENSTATTISAAGVLSAAAVTANQAVTVSASYTEGGVTRTATYAVTVVDVPAGAAVSILSPAAGTVKVNAVKLDYTMSGTSSKVYLDGAPTNYVAGNMLAGLANGNHTVRVEALDAANNVTSSEVSFTVAAEPMTVAVLTDQNGNGAGEVAALLLDYVTGSYAVYIKDSASNTQLSKVDCGAGLVPVALAVTPDLDGNGKEELALLVKDAAGAVAVVVKDSATGGDVVNLQLPAIVTPVALAVVPDSDGNGAAELAVLGVTETGRNLVVLKDLASGKVVRNVLFPATLTVKALAVVADVSGNSSPELAVLGTENGKVRCILKDAVTGALANVLLFPATLTPVALTTLADVDGNGADELVVAGMRTDGQVLAIAKDAFTKATVSTLVFPPATMPQGVAAIADLDGNGVPEIGLFGVNANGGVNVLFKDAATKAKADIVAFPGRQL